MENDGKTSSVSEAEDISSDFFDDFSKEEFMEGLSVIDSWDDGQKTIRINAEAVDSVKDLRELITNNSEKKHEHQKATAVVSKYKIDRRLLNNKQNLVNKVERKKILEITPGIRRDPTKTKIAIRKDKEIKVKQYLAKHLEESNEELRPPGTELDGYFECTAKTESKNKKLSPELTPEKQKLSISDVKPKLTRQRQSRSKSRSPARRRRRSSSRKLSPVKHSSRHFSPRYSSPTYSKHQSHHSYKKDRHNVKHFSPKRRYTPIRRQRSRSPLPFLRPRRPNSRSRGTRHSLSLSPRRSPTSLLQRNKHRSPSPKDKFYLNKSISDFDVVTADLSVKSYIPQDPPHWEMNVVPQEPLQYPNVTTYPYINNGVPSYPGYSGQYEYGVPCSVSGIPLVTAPYETGAVAHCTSLAQVPQPVPAPTLPMPASDSTVPSVPPVLTNTTTDVTTMSAVPTFTPVTICEGIVKPTYDPLTQLFADGKISKEDYLKLKPHKGVSGQHNLNLKDKVELLTRCYEAMNKLSKLQLPNRLMMPTHLGIEPKALAVSHCSPLKRQMAIEFQFTSASSAATEQRNKQLIDSIAAAVGLKHAVMSRPTRKNTREASVQTTTPYCMVCEIRASTGRLNVGTCVEREQLSRTTHTQVDEKELASTRTVFVPGGGVATSAPLSISHMTPAQLVSQLAARAKSLKETEPTPLPQPYPHLSTAYRDYQDNHYYRY